MPDPDHRGKGTKDRMVPFPASFKQALALHIDHQRSAGAVFLFEASWKKPYSGHAHRQSLEVYSHLALADAQQRYDQVIGRFPV